MNKFQKRKIVDGVELISCTSCDTFLLRDCFYRSGSGYGTRSKCKACSAESANVRYKANHGENLAKKRARDRKHHRIMASAQKKYDKLMANESRLVVIGGSMRDQIVADCSTIGINATARKTGLDQSSIRKIVAGKKARFRFSIAMKMLQEYDCDDTLRSAVPSATMFIPDGYRWSRDYDCCTSCGLIGCKHAGGGVCSSCKTRINTKSPVKVRLFQWSVYYAKCRSCGTSDKPHKARGLCNACLQRALRDGTIDKYPKTTNGIGSRARMEKSSG